MLGLLRKVRLETSAQDGCPPMANDSCINIVVVCDDRYAQHATVMLRSLLATNTKEFFRIFCLVPNDFRNKSNIERNISDLNHHNINFVYVNAGDFDSAKISGHISSAAYYRLRLDAYLPEDVTRVLYLDCDIIVKDEISSLWSTDLEGHALGACVDAAHNNDTALRVRVGLDTGKHYLNSGVLLIDIMRWREQKIGTRALDFCSAHPDRITFWDQCAINYVLSGNFKILERRWNVHPSIISRNGVRKLTLPSSVELNDAAIIHFVGDIKPWHYRCLHPKRDLYWAYLKQTTWRDYSVPDRTGLNIVKNALLQHAPFVKVIYKRLRRLSFGMRLRVRPG